MYKNNSWEFNKEVVSIFDQHVRQSVPMYDMFHKNIVDMSSYFIRSGSDVIDIGTSTGTLIKSISKNVDRDNNFIGVDIESEMIDECKIRYKNDNILFLNDNALNVNFENASVVSIMLVLQFMEMRDRTALLKKIYDEVELGSALFIVEKIKTKIHDIHDIYNDLYYDFKRSNNLSDKDILDKNKSLRGVMKPILLMDSISILEEIGFNVDITMKHNNFVSIIAIK